MTVKELVKNKNNVEIKSSIKCISSNGTLGYCGLDWGMNNSQERLFFYINTVGKIAIGKQEKHQKPFFLLNWASNFNLKNGDFNEIKIRVKNGETSFYINESKIGSISFDFYGDDVGFSVCNSTIIADFLKIEKM